MRTEIVIHAGHFRNYDWFADEVQRPEVRLEFVFLNFLPSFSLMLWKESSCAKRPSIFRSLIRSSSQEREH
jgi:hypothetical protein